MILYNAIHRFLVGDMIWETPAVLAGVIVFILALILRRRKVPPLLYLALFLALSVGLHLLIDPQIHAFQAWWTAPMGPHLVLK